MNAVEREPVENRVLNPNASEASYKPKQRSYRKTKLKKYYFFIFIFFRGDFGRGDFILEPNHTYAYIYAKIQSKGKQCGKNVHVFMHVFYA